MEAQERIEKAADACARGMLRISKPSVGTLDEIADFMEELANELDMYESERQELEQIKEDLGGICRLNRIAMDHAGQHEDNGD